MNLTEGVGGWGPLVGVTPRCKVLNEWGTDSDASQCVRHANLGPNCLWDLQVPRHLLHGSSWKFSCHLPVSLFAAIVND